MQKIYIWYVMYQQEVWYKNELWAHPKHVAQSTQIALPPPVPYLPPPSLGFCKWKVSRNLQALECVALFSFEVELDIWKCIEEARNSGSWERNRARLYRVLTALSDSVNGSSYSIRPAGSSSISSHLLPPQPFLVIHWAKGIFHENTLYIS